MFGATGQNHRGTVGAEIHDLLASLTPSAYGEVSSKIGLWIESTLTEQFMNADNLVEQLSSTPKWTFYPYASVVAQFLKEFRDAPHRSEQAKYFVDELCARVLRWWAAASAENLATPALNQSRTHRVVVGGGADFIHAASIVGSLVGCGLLSRELVRRYLIKPLISHRCMDREDAEKSIRVGAIFQMLSFARDALYLELFEPEDVRACFEVLGTEISFGGMAVPETGRINELREWLSTWLKWKEEEQSRSEEEKGTMAAKVPGEVNIGVRSSILRGIESHFVLHDVESSPGTSADDRITTASSPTLSISTISDLTPTESGEDIGEASDKRIRTRHETFYLEDGNVEIVCGYTIFRIHSPVVSFSSSKLRDILSPSTLLNAPMPEGCPRVVFKDRAEDFAVLLKMIYTPGFPERHETPEFSVFASLLRMTTKYGFSNVRDQLVKDVKGAYPTNWETYQTNEVLGEDIFGSPKPHPNAVLNLFLEQNIKFALPFAAYRVGLGGPSALISDKPGTVLPRFALVSVTHGIGLMRRVITIAAYSIVYNGNLKVCPEKACVLNVGVDHTERRMKALEKIFDVMVTRSEGDMLSPLSFGTLVCVDCGQLLEQAHLGCRKELVWAALPSLLGWESWEGV